MDLKSEIKNVILSSLKEPSDVKIGIEIENIIYNDKNERIMVNLGNDFSATELLQVLNNKKNIFENYSLNPYQYTWLNSFSKFYKIDKTFEVDYWGISGKNLNLKIRDHASQNKIEKTICIYGSNFQKFF